MELYDYLYQRLGSHSKVERELERLEELEREKESKMEKDLKENIEDLSLHTKQNGSHDLHPTLKNDSRWQTIIGNSGDTDKSADKSLENEQAKTYNGDSTNALKSKSNKRDGSSSDKSQGFSNNKPVVSLDSFDSIIEDLELKVYNQRELLQLFLSSDLIIDDMDYNELLEWVNNEIEDDYINKFICEWKDYAFLRGKLETAKQLKEIVERAINEFDITKTKNWRKELRKALGVNNG